MGDKKKIIGGCCGFRHYRPPKDWREKYKQIIQAYASVYPLVEVNSTFYKLPRVSTVKKWRSLIDEVKPSFIFTVKANQKITHLPSSPTYKKAKLEINDSIKDKLGFFKSTEEVFNAWKNTEKICQALRAEVCLFQTPPNFKPTSENLDNLKNFFEQINPNFDLAFESRGKEWSKKIINDLSFDLSIIPVFDPLKVKIEYNGDKAYYRLHGLARSLYKYKYLNEDLVILKKKCLESKNNVIYVLFNNYEMFNDCKRFLDLLKTGKLAIINWGPNAVVEKLQVSFPIKKEELLTKYGKWWVWVNPDKRMRIEQLILSMKKDEIESKKELLTEIEKVFHEFHYS